MGHADTFDINKLNSVEEMTNALKGGGNSEIDKIYRGVESTLNTFNNHILKSMGANSSILLRTIYRSMDEELMNVLAQPKLVKLINDKLSGLQPDKKQPAISPKENKPIDVEQVTKIQPIHDTSIITKTNTLTKNILNKEILNKTIETLVNPIIKHNKIENVEQVDEIGETEEFNEEIEEVEPDDKKSEEIDEEDQHEQNKSSKTNEPSSDSSSSSKSEPIDENQFNIIAEYLERVKQIVDEHKLYFSNKKEELETTHDNREKEDPDFLKEILELNKQFEDDQQTKFLEQQVEQAKKEQEKEKKKANLIKDLLTGKKKLHDLRPDVMLRNYIDKKRKAFNARINKKKEAIKKRIVDAVSPKAIFKRFLKRLDSQDEEQNNKNNGEKQVEQKQSITKTIVRSIFRTKNKNDAQQQTQTKQPTIIQTVIGKIGKFVGLKRFNKQKKDYYVLREKQLIKGKWSKRYIYSLFKQVAARQRYILMRGKKGRKYNDYIKLLRRAASGKRSARLGREGGNLLGGRNITAGLFNLKTSGKSPELKQASSIALNILKNSKTKNLNLGNMVSNIAATNNRPDKLNSTTPITTLPSPAQKPIIIGDSNKKSQNVEKIQDVEKSPAVKSEITKSSASKMPSPKKALMASEGENKEKTATAKTENKQQKTAKTANNTKKVTPQTANAITKKVANKAAKPKMRKYSSLNAVEKKAYNENREKENKRILKQQQKEQKKSVSGMKSKISGGNAAMKSASAQATANQNGGQSDELQQKIENLQAEQQEYKKNVHLAGSVFMGGFSERFLKANLPRVEKFTSKLRSLTGLYSKLFKNIDKSADSAEKNLFQKGGGFKGALTSILIKVGLLILVPLMLITLVRSKITGFKNQYMPKKDQAKPGSGFKIFGLEVPSFSNIIDTGKAIWNWCKDKGKAIWHSILRIKGKISSIFAGGKLKVMWEWLKAFLKKLLLAIVLKKSGGIALKLFGWLGKIIPPPIGPVVALVPELIWGIVKAIIMRTAVTSIDGGKKTNIKQMHEEKTADQASTVKTLSGIASLVKPLASVKNILGSSTDGSNTKGMGDEWKGTIMGGKLSKIGNLDEFKKGKKANKKIKYKAKTFRSKAAKNAINVIKTPEDRAPYIKAQVQSLNSYAKSMNDLNNKTFANPKLQKQPLYTRDKGWNPNFIVKPEHLASQISNDAFVPIANKKVSSFGKPMTPQQQYGGILPFTWKNLNGNTVSANPIAFEAARAGKLAQIYQDLLDKLNSTNPEKHDKVFNKFDVKWQKAQDPLAWGSGEAKAFMLNGKKFIEFYNKFQNADEAAKKQMEKTQVKDVGQKWSLGQFLKKNKQKIKKGIIIAAAIYFPGAALSIAVTKLAFKGAKKLIQGAAKVLKKQIDEHKIKRISKAFAKKNKTYAKLARFEEITKIGKEFSKDKFKPKNPVALLNNWLIKMSAAAFLGKGMISPSKKFKFGVNIFNGAYFSKNINTLGFMEWFISKYKKFEGLDMATLIRKKAGRKQVASFSTAAIIALYSVYGKPYKELMAEFLKTANRNWRKEYPNPKERKEAYKKEQERLEKKINDFAKIFTLRNWMKKLDSMINFKNVKIIQYKPPKASDLETSKDKANSIEGGSDQGEKQGKSKKEKIAGFAKSVGKGIFTFMKWTSPAYLAYRAAKKMSEVATSIGQARKETVKKVKEHIKEKWREWRDKMLSPQTLGELKETTYELSCNLQEYMKLMNDAKNKGNTLILNNNPKNEKPPLIFMDEPEM